MNIGWGTVHLQKTWLRWVPLQHFNKGRIEEENSLLKQNLNFIFWHRFSLYKSGWSRRASYYFWFPNARITVKHWLGFHCFLKTDLFLFYAYESLAWLWCLSQMGTREPLELVLQMAVSCQAGTVSWSRGLYKSSDHSSGPSRLSSPGFQYPSLNYDHPTLSDRHEQNLKL